MSIVCFSMVTDKAKVRLLVGPSNTYNVLAGMRFGVPIAGFSFEGQLSRYEALVENLQIGIIIKDSMSEKETYEAIGKEILGR